MVLMREVPPVGTRGSQGCLLPSLREARNWLGSAELALPGNGTTLSLAGLTFWAGGEGFVPTAPTPTEAQRQLGRRAAGTRRGQWSGYRGRRFVAYK